MLPEILRTSAPSGPPSDHNGYADADEDRLDLGEVAECLQAGLRVSHDDLRVSLEDRRNLDYRHALLNRRERGEQVGLR